MLLANRNRLPSPLKLKFFLAVCAILCIQTSYAAPPETPSNPSSAVPEKNWRIQIAPYVWAMSMNGRVQVGRFAAQVDESFADVFKHMNWGGMLWVDAFYKEKFDLFLNAMYAALSNSSNDGMLSVNAKNKFGLFSAGASYEAYKHCFDNSCNGSSVAIEPYAGLRYTVNDTSVKTSFSNINMQGNLNEKWADPLLGARLRYKPAKAWQIIFAGDVGGTNTTNHYSYNVLGLVGYNPHTVLTNTNVYFGYRYLGQHYVNGSGNNYFNWNMKLFGPVLGISILF